MNILEKRIQVQELTEFEDLLTKLDSIDLKILGKIKDVEKESFIISHKLIFIPKLEKIDFSKIKKEEIENIAKNLEELKKMEIVLLPKLNTFEIAESNLPSAKKYVEEDKKLLKLIKDDLVAVFESIKECAELIPFLYEYVNEVNQEGLEKSFSDLSEHLFRIKRFARELKRYAEYWIERVEKAPHLNISKITKSRDYLKDIQAHPNLVAAIDSTEDDIERWPGYSSKLHKTLRHVKALGNPNVNHALHARVDDNFRIVYMYDSKAKHLRYLRMMHHNELDVLKSINW